jgi:hypothetical protein
MLQSLASLRFQLTPSVWDGERPSIFWYHGFAMYQCGVEIDRNLTGASSITVLAWGWATDWSLHRFVL